MALAGAPSRPATAALHVLVIVALLAERGYAMSAEALGLLLALPAEVVRAAARSRGELALVRDHVVPAGQEHLVDVSARRAAAHAEASARWRPVGLAYARAIARHVPWARVVLFSGSLASGGFDDGDDIDVSLVVAPGTKHLSYVAAVAFAVPFAWRHRRRAHGRDARLPLAPKLVCINVVWTEAEARPFARDDPAMALEIALTRPVWGAERWRALLAANPRLTEGFAAVPAQDEVEASPSRLGRALAIVTRSALIRRPLDAACYHLARAIHAWVRLHRRGAPDVRARVERLEATKHPYAILDREPRGRA